MIRPPDLSLGWRRAARHWAWDAYMALVQDHIEYRADPYADPRGAAA